MRLLSETANTAQTDTLSVVHVTFTTDLKVHMVKLQAMFVICYLPCLFLSPKAIKSLLLGPLDCETYLLMISGNFIALLKITSENSLLSHHLLVVESEP